MTKVPFPYSADEHLTEAYLMGCNHAQGIACHNVPRIGDRIDPYTDWVGLGRYVTEDNARDYHEMLCQAAANNTRQYSPFEFIANTFNSSEEDVVDELWEAFDAGISDTIYAETAGYDYGDLPTREAEE